MLGQICVDPGDRPLRTGSLLKSSDAPTERRRRQQERAPAVGELPGEADADGSECGKMDWKVRPRAGAQAQRSVFSRHRGREPLTVEQPADLAHDRTEPGYWIGEPDVVQALGEQIPAHRSINLCISHLPVDHDTGVRSQGGCQNQLLHVPEGNSPGCRAAPRDQTSERAHQQGAAGVVASAPHDSHPPTGGPEAHDDFRDDLQHAVALDSLPRRTRLRPAHRPLASTAAHHRQPPKESVPTSKPRSSSHTSSTFSYPASC
jgi:hypothetical protein